MLKNYILYITYVSFIKLEFKFELLEYLQSNNVYMVADKDLSMLKDNSETFYEFM